MRIERVEALATTFPHGREELSYCFARVQGDDGTVGWGEACDSFGCSYAGVVAACIEQALAPLAVGEDPAQPERLVTKLRGWTRRRLGDQWVVMQAISAVELACWDLAGKAAGRPVSDLFGTYRDRVPVYASSVFLEEASPEGHVKLLAPCIGGGVETVKLRLAVGWRRDLDTLAAVQGLLAARSGDLDRDVQIAVDANECFTVPTALEIARRLAELDVIWLEEPVPQHQGAALDRLAERSPVPIAYGEHLFGLHDFAACLGRRQADVLQPDAATCGGLSEARRIAALAAQYGARVVPHVAAGPVALAAALHLAASVQPVHLIEYPYPLADFWAVVAPGTRLGPDALVDGCLEVPSTPGLGIELDEDEIRRRPYRPPPPRQAMPDRFVGGL